MRNLKPAVLLGTVLVLAVVMAACARSGDDKSSEPLRRYSIHGVIMRLNPDGKLATIRHQKIEGYMDAMTMTFPVKDQKEFDSLQLDHCIDGTVFVQGDSFWVGEVKHLDTPADQCVVPPSGQ